MPVMLAVADVTSNIRHLAVSAVSGLLSLTSSAAWPSRPQWPEKAFSLGILARCRI